MKKLDIKLILAYAWPFIGLALFFVWAWFYIKPMLPEDFFSWEKAGDKIAGIFIKEEEWTHPDEKYDFHYVQDKLKPKTEARLGLEEEFSLNNIGAPEKAVVISADTSEDLEKIIKKAAGGEAIKLGAGEFEINLEISKDIALIGQGASTSLSALDPKKPVIRSIDNELSVKNLEIGSGRVGLEADSARINIESVKFSGLSATACYLKSSGLNFKKSYIESSGSALKTLSSSGEISRSIIKNNKRSGIDLRSSNFKIFENIIIGNQSYGIYADQDSEAEIEGNFIDNNSGFQVRIEGEREIYR